MNKRTCLMISLVTLLASATQATQQQLATSIREARTEATRTSEQLKATLDALNALAKQTQGDLRPAYNAFAAEIPKTEAAATWTRTRVTWMASDGRQYFKSWQATIDGIANESLRKKAQKRLNNVRGDYDKVEVALQKAGDKFRPFLSDLSDIKRTLATDITPGGVKAIRSTVTSANWNHKFVNTAINSALKGMDKMEKSLSTEVK